MKGYSHWKGNLTAGLRGRIVPKTETAGPLWWTLLSDQSQWGSSTEQLCLSFLLSDFLQAAEDWRRRTECRGEKSSSASYRSARSNSTDHQPSVFHLNPVLLRRLEKIWPSWNLKNTFVSYVWYFQWQNYLFPKNNFMVQENPFLAVQYTLKLHWPSVSHHNPVLLRPLKKIWPSSNLKSTLV